MDSKQPEGRVASKRSPIHEDRGAYGNVDDEVEEFFSLLERIHATNKFFKEKGISCRYRDEPCSGQKHFMTVEKRKPRSFPWKFTFEWEDFRQTNVDGYNRSSMDVHQQGVQSAENGYVRSSYKEPLDLNVEPRSE